MAFPDRLSNFLGKLPQEAALYIRNAVNDTKDMEVVYRLARQWSTNVRSIVVLRRAPQLLRFGKPRSKSSGSSSDSPTESPSDSERGDEKESDTEDESDIVVQVNKADMEQVTCSRCHNRGHFARECKDKWYAYDHDNDSTYSLSQSSSSSSSSDPEADNHQRNVKYRKASTTHKYIKS